MQQLFIPEFNPPMEPFVIWQGGFTPEEASKVIATHELSEFQLGKVGGNAVGETRLDGVVRETDVAWIVPTDENAWIYGRMRSLASKINFDKYQFELSHFQHLQFGRYKPGGHYTWHTDSGPSVPEHRKLSFVVGLTDPSLYEGGELQVWTGGDPETSAAKLRLRVGDVVAFPSFTMHRVTPVTKGERCTLVGWAVGPKFK